MSKARELASLGNAYSDGALSNRNKIINGAMTIDQRNGGSAVTGAGFSVDRFYNVIPNSAGTQARSTVAPAGFTNSLLVSITSATAPSTSTVAYVSHRIEGLNTANLDFGKSTAQSVTLSFWVRSSITGSYAVGFLNDAENRSYVSTYTVSAANTWEYKTITVVGDTSGTWVTNSGKGLSIFWDLGSGSNFEGTADSWQDGTLLRTSGTVDFANNAGATFYLTGVQLEVGDTATPFEHRSYGQELALCQRYYQRFDNFSISFGSLYSSNGLGGAVTLPVEMRAAPSVIITDYYNAVSNKMNRFYEGTTARSVSLANLQRNVFTVATTDASLAGYGAFGKAYLDAEL